MRSLPRFLPRVSNFLRAWAEGAVRWTGKEKQAEKESNRGGRPIHGWRRARPMMADPPIMARNRFSAGGTTSCSRSW